MVTRRRRRLLAGTAALSTVGAAVVAAAPQAEAGEGPLVPEGCSTLAAGSHWESNCKLGIDYKRSANFVTGIQRHLRRTPGIVPNPTVDGIYGGQTADAVYDWQVTYIGASGLCYQARVVDNGLSQCPLGRTWRSFDQKLEYVTTLFGFKYYKPVGASNPNATYAWRQAWPMDWQTLNIGGNTFVPFGIEGPS